MTVGTKTADLTYAYGGGKAGSYFRKTWSGADYSLKAKPAKGSPTKPVRVPGYIRKLTADLKDGQWARVGKPYEVPKRRVRPRRALRVEQHPYQCQYTEANYPRATFYNRNTGLTGDLALNAVAPMFAGGVSPWTANDDIALINKLRERIVGSDFNVGVFLAEASESLQMVAQAATRIYKAVGAAHKGNFAQAARHLVDGTDRAHLRKRKAVAKNWLELQYGWLPLISDAEEGAKFLAELLQGPLTQRYRARIRRPGAVVSNNGNAKFGEAWGWETGQIIAFLKQKDAVLLSGLTDPASVAWEKIPYSFVADWFIPIGNYLAAHATARALIGTFVTTRRTILAADNVMPNPSSAIQYNDGQTYSYRDLVISRTVSTTLSVPLPTVKPFSKVAGWRHCANAVALVTGAGTVQKLRDLASSTERALDKNIARLSRRSHLHFETR
nr:MAG: hypothetical protein 1 [Leviviridae sp.]